MEKNKIKLVYIGITKIKGSKGAEKAGYEYAKFIDVLHEQESDYGFGSVIYRDSLVFANKLTKWDEIGHVIDAEPTDKGCKGPYSVDREAQKMISAAFIMKCQAKSDTVRAQLNSGKELRTRNSTLKDDMMASLRESYKQLPASMRAQFLSRLIYEITK